MQIAEYLKAVVTQLNDMYEFEMKKQLDEQRKQIEVENDPLKTLDTQQVAKVLGVEQEYVQRLARQGVIPAIRLGKKYMFRAVEVEKYILSLEEKREKDIQRKCSNYGVSRRAL